MAVINEFVVGVLDAVDQQLRARQDQTSAVSQIPPNTNTPTDPNTAPSSPSNTPSNQPSGGPTSSPLLFFVALGFGVVFTNLWIIVGVKYCFRYNARNRALRNGEEIDPIGLDHMQARPHRRRREKKLMTMDEVNERFPLMKYKTWVASRAREGLSTSGGVSIPPSRAQSIRDVEPSDLSSPTETVDSAACQPNPTASILKAETKPPQLVLDTEPFDHEDSRISEKDALSPNGDDVDPKKESHSFEVHENQSSENPAPNSSDDDDDEDQINAVIPPELLATPGDSCAICIDTLEQEDEIRGLSCGHAFHAGCLDPWLTSRRACCPLCKADYHVPKTRNDGETIVVERVSRRRPDRSNIPLYSQSLWSSIFSNSRAPIPRTGNQTIERNRRSPWRPPGATPVQTSGANLNNSNSTSLPTRSLNIPFFSIPFRSLHIPSMQNSRRNRGAFAESDPRSEASLSRLEAGITNR